MNHTTNNWSSRIAFIFAASAAAIGLGNIWRFPYLAGENGGGAFVLIYLACVLILGIPLLITEIVIGKLGRSDPVKAIANLAAKSQHSRNWGAIGGLNITASFLILTYYTVVAGWVVDYVVRSIFTDFSYNSIAATASSFAKLKHSYGEMLLTTSVVIIGAMMINILGIKRGLERAVLIMFPALLLLLVLLLGYAMTNGDFSQAIDFLFKPDLSELSMATILHALGQAFFSLNIAMGVTITFSAFLPKDTPIVSSAIAISIADTGFAILAGMIIFPIVFKYHLHPGTGPSLVFKTLPLAFAKMPGGRVIAVAFFLMLFFAAFSSVIALFEPAILWLEERWQLSRVRATLRAGSLCWLLSLATIGSFALPKYFSLFNISYFRAVDFVTSSIMLPLGGLLLAVFCGWKLSQQHMKKNLHWKANLWFYSWRFSMRYISPLAITLIILASLQLL